MTDQGSDSGEGSALGAATPGGLREAGRVGRALRHMAYEGAGEEAELWAGFDGQVAPVKPHKASDPAWAALRKVVEVSWRGAAGLGACSWSLVLARWARRTLWQQAGRATGHHQPGQQPTSRC